MNTKSAFITGITGQDGSYLAELLLDKGYRVHGMVRRASSFNRRRIEHLYHERNSDRLFLHYGDITDSSNIHQLLVDVRPDEIYNLAAQSHVKVSFELPEYTTDVNAMGTLRLLNAIRQTGIKSRFYQASTSELYGKVVETPQRESTPFHPRSPYAVSKLHAYWAVVNYREAYGMHASNGILFNHESPRRGENFVTRKIAIQAAKIKAGLERTLSIGNLDARRDWGYAPDYVRAMWQMLQQQQPDDYVIATGEMHTVREFVEKAFAVLDISIEWEGEAGREVGRNGESGETVIRVDPRYYRPAEVQQLCGDSTKARSTLEWRPSLYFEQLVESMVRAEWDTIKPGT